MKKIVALVLAVAMVALALCACGGGAAAPAADAAAASSDKKVVGLLMPTKEQTIWSVQGDTLTEAYKAAGYDVLIEFAEDDSAKQAMQIENMISKGANALVIVAVDCAALTDACEKAKEAGCVVIAEDRLIENTDAVDFYVTFDLDKMGELQGQYIADALGLADGKGPFNLEIFSGSQDDTNATHFYDGAMKVLQPYLDNGKLVVQSGQVSYAETAIQGWDSAKAQSRCDNLLSGFYSDKHLDACLVAADCLDIGVISSLESMGYGTADCPFPVTTGQDAELAAVKNILAGKQSMTAFLDAKALAEIIVPATDSLMSGGDGKPSTSYNNGVKDVPASTYSPFTIDATNVDHLIDVGFYTKEEIYG